MCVYCPPLVFRRQSTQLSECDRRIIRQGSTERTLIQSFVSFLTFSRSEIAQQCVVPGFHFAQHSSQACLRYERTRRGVLCSSIAQPRLSYSVGNASQPPTLTHRKSARDAAVQGDRMCGLRRANSPGNASHPPPCRFASRSLL